MTMEYNFILRLTQQIGIYLLEELEKALGNLFHQTNIIKIAKYLLIIAYIGILELLQIKHYILKLVNNSRSSFLVSLTGSSGANALLYFLNIYGPSEGYIKNCWY